MRVRRTISSSSVPAWRKTIGVNLILGAILLLLFPSVHIWGKDVQGVLALLSGVLAMAGIDLLLVGAASHNPR